MSQKCTNHFETVYSSKLWMDFDDIWQKYLKDSKIEFYVSVFISVVSIDADNMPIN